MVICLERGADLHMAQLMPLPFTVSCFSKIQTGFTFLVPAHLGSPGKRAVKRVCVVCVLELLLIRPTSPKTEPLEPCFLQTHCLQPTNSLKTIPTSLLTDVFLVNQSASLAQCTSSICSKSGHLVINKSVFSFLRQLTT